MTLIIFTTAPEILDGPQTRPVGHAGFTTDGIAARAVSVELGACVGQVQRYLTAGGRVWTLEEWREAAGLGGVVAEALEWVLRCTHQGAPSAPEDQSPLVRADWTRG